MLEKPWTMWYHGRRDVVIKMSFPKVNLFALQLLQILQLFKQKATLTPVEQHFLQTLDQLEALADGDSGHRPGKTL